MIPKTDDRRVLFAIPWYGKVVLGTTDTPLDKISLEPKALQKEIDFILMTAGKYLTMPPVRSDVLCVFAGLRPLAADPEHPLATKEVSRRHKIILSPSGMLSVIGGKWTSYRRMAQETIDKAIKSGFIESRNCSTGNFRFDVEKGNLKNERLKIYGSGASEIERIIETNPGLGDLLDPALPYTKAEIIWICRNEMPIMLEDVLARRTRSLFLDVRASLAIAPVVADIMAEELRCDSKWKDQQLEEYKKIVFNYL
jgi:glycerol-3-phosphate dehydrogenase